MTTSKTWFGERAGDESPEPQNVTVTQQQYKNGHTWGFQVTDAKGKTYQFSSEREVKKVAERRGWTITSTDVKVY